MRLVLDFALRENEAPARLAFPDPVAFLAAHRLADVLPILSEAEAAARRGLWAVGFVAYEAAPAFDAAFTVHAPVEGLPLAWFAVTPPPLPLVPSLGREGTRGKGWTSDLPPAAWAEAVSAIHEAIARGETYQVNLTRRLRAEAPPAGFDAFALYENLRMAQAGAEYAAFLDTGRFQILSVSPELFFRTQGRRVMTRPMKGTARRGRWTEEDAERADRLRRSAKERAENVMIVDLLRNDLGRVARTGSVRTPHLFAVERYPTVWQMTSTVEAVLPESIGIPKLFAALFPCGSVTGAPKVSTLRHIVARELSPRGVYCGAVGVIRPGGDAVFNVAIRTLVHDRETGALEYGVGAGITWDSTATAEWAETEAKASVLLRTASSVVPPAPFDLLETLRLEAGAYVLRGRHQARLADSAAYFGRPCEMAAVDTALDAFAATHPTGAWRVRLCVAPDGQPRVEGAPLEAPWLTFADSGEPWPVVPTRAPVSRHDAFLFHKTTRRAVYEDARENAPPDAYDVLLWNEEGEATEFTIGNLVAEIDGALWTPPRDCGLLAGTLRADLLERGMVRERILPLAELSRATRLWLINGVRGSVPVRLAHAA